MEPWAIVFWTVICCLLAPFAVALIVNGIFALFLAMIAGFITHSDTVANVVFWFFFIVMGFRLPGLHVGVAV